MSFSKNFTRGLGALALAGLLWSSQAGPALAQPGPGGGPHAGGGHIQMLTERLSLTGEQQTQIKEILERHRERARAEKATYEASLSPEQRAAMEARRKEWQERHQERVAQRGERPEGEQPKGERPRGDRKPGPDGVSGSGPMAQLTPEQREAFRSKREAERQTIDSEIRAVLTPQQAAEFDKLKESRPERGPRGPRGERPDNG